MRMVGLALCVIVLALILPPRSTASAATLVGPKAYYLALGDSLAFGYQPDFNYSNGYAPDFYHNLQTHGTSHFEDLGCTGETSTTFIKGGCPYPFLRKIQYRGAQLNAALEFIHQHPGQVSPVTIDIGANDALGILDPGKCTVGSNSSQVLATFDANFKSILQQLSAALAGGGDILTMNLYDPYQNLCARNPQLLAFLQTLNAHIAGDAALFNVPVADVFTAFGGATTPNPNLCSYTWICNFLFHDIHATDKGYGVIATTYETTAGY